MTSLVVEVARPRFWWRADGDRLREWANLQVSPDDADGYQRHEDRDDQRWDLVATAVASVGAELAAGAWTPLFYEDEPTKDGRVEVDLPSPLSPTETHIVRSWFNDAEAVCTDPWDADLGVQNGRHRLWDALRHSSDLLLPIRGTSLRYANPYAASEYESRPGVTDRWQDSFTTYCLDELYFIDWFDHRDALNRRFVAALQEAARGQWPDPTALGHDTPEPLVEPGSTAQPPPPTRLQRIAAWLRGAENHHR
ncbi:hypothetical protein [Promicromonospora sp. NFX87]|uniref:hypothetical protein n=1 Tax=Promicromonospora sp. NFX87 TaxID=3402691 RepID=UPI003AFA6B9F